MIEIDRGLPERDAWPEGVLERLREWEQGDIVAVPPLFYFANPLRPIWNATRNYAEDATGPEVIWPEDDEFRPPYGIVTTHTCDLSEEDSRRPLRPWVQIAPVYAVTSWKRRKLELGAAHGTGT